MSAPTTASPFALALEAVYDSGLGHPLPIQPRSKVPAVHGHTGVDGSDIARLRAAQLSTEHPRAGVGIRLAYDVVGLDFDVHKRSRLLAEFEAKFGWRPTRVRSTSRDDGSGIFLVRVPADPTRRYQSNLKASGLEEVDILHHGYRYAIVAPTVHPDTGRAYRWLDGDTEVDIPDVGDLEELPGHVLEAITHAGIQRSSEPVRDFDLGSIPEEHRDAYTTALETEGHKMLADTIAYLGGIAYLATGERNAAGEGWEAGEKITWAWFRLGELVASPWSGITAAIVEQRIEATDWPREFKRYARDKARVSRNAIEAPLIYGSPTDEFDFANYWLPAADPRVADAALEPSVGSWNTLAPPDHLGMTWESLVETYPLMGAKRLDRAHLFHTKLDPESGAPKITGTLLPEIIARYIAQGVARGDDGELWWYRGGVFVPDPLELQRRIVWAMGNDYTRSARDRISDAVSVMPMRMIPDEPDQRYINAANGMVDWAAGTITEHDPSFLSGSQLASRFEPGLATPNFDAWLNTVIAPEDRDLALDILAYLMLHGNPFQKAVLLHGGGSNGKGTLLRLIATIVGKRNMSSVTLDGVTNSRFDAAEMHGKHINIAGDIDATRARKTGLFKSITGGDSIKAERKYVQGFKFTPWCVAVFSANELWTTVDSSEGYMRRWVILPMHARLSGGYDETLLSDERDAIFTKLVQRLPSVMSRGHFRQTVSSSQALDELAQGSDSLLAWYKTVTEPNVGDFTVDLDNGSIWTTAEELIRSYKAWCMDEGIEKPKSWREQKAWLINHGHRERPRTKDARGLLGIWKTP